nr:hypothetical protein [Tanacetum cinerariifolium]
MPMSTEIKLTKDDEADSVDSSKYRGVFLGYSQNSKAYVVLNKHTMKVEESINVTFNRSHTPTKLSPLVDNDVGEEEAIRKNTKIVNTNNEEDESIEVDKIVNIKESKNHPLDQVIGNLNQRTLSSSLTWRSSLTENTFGLYKVSRLAKFCSVLDVTNTNASVKETKPHMLM